MRPFPIMQGNFRLPNGSISIFSQLVLLRLKFVSLLGAWLRVICIASGLHPRVQLKRNKIHLGAFLVHLRRRDQQWLAQRLNHFLMLLNRMLRGQYVVLPGLSILGRFNTRPVILATLFAALLHFLFDLVEVLEHYFLLFQNDWVSLLCRLDSNRPNVLGLLSS
jgi:hypothetical protein